MTATQCPRCGQGSVQRHVFKATGKYIRVCDECEAVWPDDGVLDPHGFEDFEAFASQRGGAGRWDELSPAKH
ncbi:hypothetical protein [Knoellia sinensis]|uniref:hypothetical protein n=1 Tax=Knoellia sinensis TaxID=136100 RepID=UPI000B29C47C|nr:hypothetical protein [Knoellia sinensis]